ncbi:MAG TPA: hypothetical protein VL625_08085 [Patescibacteria group bacterium]|jgi:hypothetical protein|nr:hypothetical protein [Patescibacteria group bacterium]
MRDATKAPRSGIRLWFPFFVTILVFGTIGASAFHMHKMVQEGHGVWWPYPMFAVMCWLILKANHTIYGGDER